MVRTLLLMTLGAFVWLSCVSMRCKAPLNKTYTIDVTIYNIRNKSGRIQLHMYKDQQSYTAQRGWKGVLLYKQEMTNNTLHYTFKGIPSGTYGLALLDDENKNTVMDYGWVMPKEGFGFGDYYHTKWSTPHFDDFKFHLSSDKSVKMKVRYM